MNRSSILVLIAAAGFLLPGCNKALDPGDGNLITVEATVAPTTKVAYDGNKTSFTAGDKIAVYAWLGSASEVPATRVVDGVVNTYDGSAWTPASLMRWKNGTDAHYFLGVSPVHAISSFTADEYALDPADYTASDLLFAANLAGVKSGDSAVKLGFKHAMAKLTVNLSFRNQFDGTPEVGTVTLSAKKTASVNYITQTVGATGDATSVSLPAVTANSSYSAILVPQEGVRKIAVTIAGKDYVYTAGEDIPLASGQVTTVDLLVGRDKIELGTVSISDWVNDDPLSDQTIILERGFFQLGAFFPQALLPMQDGWQEGDVVFIFFDSIAAPKHLQMRYDGAKWTFTEMNGAMASPGCLGLANGSTGTMYAYYLPFGSDAVISAGETEFVFGTAAYDCYLTATLPYTVSDGRLRGFFDFALPVVTDMNAKVLGESTVLFFLEDSKAKAGDVIELREPKLTPLGLASVAGDFSASAGTPAHGAPLKGYPCPGKGYAFYGILPEEASVTTGLDYRFTLVRDGWDGDYYSLVLRKKKILVDEASDCIENLPTTDWVRIRDCKPIDLGFDVSLADGTKKRIYWSSRNLGATSDFPTSGSVDSKHATWGDYYAWGETTPHYNKGHAYDNPMKYWDWRYGVDGYNWGSYRFSLDTEGEAFSRYSSSDGKTVLGAEDDAAFVILGDGWRIPGMDEWLILMDENLFTSEWDDRYKGRLVTVKGGKVKETPTIFLPAAGARGIDSAASLDYAESEGRYWSSGLTSVGPTWAWSTGLTSSKMFNGGAARKLGYSIRPVYD